MSLLSAYSGVKHSLKQETDEWIKKIILKNKNKNTFIADLKFWMNSAGSCNNFKNSDALNFCTVYCKIYSGYVIRKSY